MKHFLVIVVAVMACNKKSGGGSSGSATETGSGSATATGSGSATATTTGSAEPTAPVEDVSCKDAAKAYANNMALAPGNILSDAKPDKGLISWTALSMEDYCVGEDGCCVPWTPQERACVKASTPATVASCFTGAALSQVNAGLTEVVTNALKNKAANEAAEAGSGSATP
jgi:hypothetical protein